MSLSISQASDLIDNLKQTEIALGRPPETWYTYSNHVYGAAKVAKTIASKISDMNPDEMYVCALLHDISRTEEDRKQRFHGILGFEKLIDKDEKAAHCALIHMFPWNVLPPFEKCGKLFYGNKKDYDFTADYIKKHTLSDTDLLVQLADGLANKDGIVTLEQRAKEVAERHRFENVQELLQPYCKIKSYFDKKIGTDIYSLFNQQPISYQHQR